jgi:hypothetical protein
MFGGRVEGGGWMEGEKSSFLRLEWEEWSSELCERRANFGLEMGLRDGMEVRLMKRYSDLQQGKEVSNFGIGYLKKGHISRESSAWE